MFFIVFIFFLNIFASEQNKINNFYRFNKFFYCSSRQKYPKEESKQFFLHFYHADSAFSHVFNLMDREIKGSEEKNIFLQDVLNKRCRSSFSFFIFFF
jgi:hypothetical protein